MFKKIIIPLILVVIVSSLLYTYGTKTTQVVTVKTLDHKIYGSGDDITDTYLVFTSNGVFKNSDSFLYWKFNSSDVQNDLVEGQTFEIKYYGWRVPFLSWYPNIISAKAI